MAEQKQWESLGKWLFRAIEQFECTKGKVPGPVQVETLLIAAVSIYLVGRNATNYGKLGHVIVHEMMTTMRDTFDREAMG